MARRALGPASLRVVRAVETLPERPWLLAVSGGPDSMALAAAAGIVATRRGDQSVRVVVVDHQLQPGSAAVAQQVQHILGDRGLEVIVRSVEVGSGSGPEAAARDARHRALGECAATWEREMSGPVAIVLGHTRDDQAETVLLQLARGSGIRSLSGMAPVAGRLHRPLLDLPRADTVACCDELCISYWQDPHNADDRFARVRVRRTVLPVLEDQLGPGVAAALARTAELARRDADLLDRLADETPIDDEPDCATLRGLPDALRTRVLKRWLLARGAGEVTARAMAAVDALVTDWRGQGAADLPNIRVSRVQGRLRSVAR